MSKYYYTLEVERTMGKGEEWVKLFECAKTWGEGYINCSKYQSPRLAHRLVRSDGKVILETKANPNVSIGMVAGFPTAEQYEYAAERALEKAQSIRELSEKHEEHRNRRGNNVQ